MECQLEIANRMFLTGLFGMYLLGVYVKQRGDAKVTKDYLAVTAVILSKSFGVAAFRYLPDANKIVTLVCGKPRSLQCHTVFFVVTILIIVEAAKECRRLLARRDNI